MELKGDRYRGAIYYPQMPPNLTNLFGILCYYIDKKLGRLITHLSNDYKLSIFPPNSSKEFFWSYLFF
jgi:hypothetical protein